MTLMELPIVGFENHGGRTYINDNEPLGKVLFGYGNNGDDGMEGVRYKNVIGTYLHGPLLPKNPHVCDLLLANALDAKVRRTASSPRWTTRRSWRQTGILWSGLYPAADSGSGRMSGFARHCGKVEKI